MRRRLARVLDFGIDKTLMIILLTLLIGYETKGVAWYVLAGMYLMIFAYEFSKGWLADGEG